MIYPQNFEKKIAFDQIRTMVKKHCLSSLGGQLVGTMDFQTNYQHLLQLHEEVEEFRSLLLFDSVFPSQNYFDLRQQWTYLQREGTYIDLESLCQLRACLQTVEQCISFFNNRKETGKYPRLCSLTDKTPYNPWLVVEIDKIVDDKGKIKDSASENLFSIRKQINSIESEIGKTIRKILQQARQNKLVDENADITIRDGRLVLPVPAVNKRKIKGFVHDESTSGQTYFIEPQEVFEANNLLSELQILERKEIINILTTFSELLRPELSSISHYFDYLAYIDFTRAKAKFAIELQACKPIINDYPMVQWKQARHPLLLISLQNQQKEIVPVDITLSEKKRILIVSGPNAGGKSVCLKTLALLQYMFQHGLPVLTSPMSEFGIFQNIFIDIGDEQSIDNDLSTYSSHLLNCKMLLTHTDSCSLFLIDELGSGTDPQYGGAIAETLIEELAAKQTFGFVTTHFGNLKKIAQHIDCVENGTMLFDNKQMKPTFQLKIGQFGTSFTFEIAQQIGLENAFIAKAKNKVGKMQIRYDKLVQELQQKEIELQEQEKMLTFTDNRLAELIAKYELLNKELKEKRFEMIGNAKREAKSILDSSNKLIEKTIKEIKQSKADKDVVKTLRTTIKQEVQKIEQTLEEEQPKKKTLEKMSTYKPKIGDSVLIVSTGAIGEITSLSGKEIVVSFNSVNLRTTTDKVEKIEKKELKKIERTGKQSIYENINQKAMNFNLRIDLRGERAETALILLERYLDDAILLGIKEVNVLHGKGNGILREVVREYLRCSKIVRHFEDAHIQHGGNGITIVELY